MNNEYQSKYIIISDFLPLIRCYQLVVTIVDSQRESSVIKCPHEVTHQSISHMREGV